MAFYSVAVRKDSKIGLAAVKVVMMWLKDEIYCKKYLALFEIE